MSQPFVRASLVAAIAAAVALVAVAAAAAPAGPMPQEPHGEWVSYAGAGGDSVHAYLVYPERADPAPAVIVIHEIYGMSEWIQAVADTFAMQGYVAIAPDLLTRRGGTAQLADPRQTIRTLPPESIGVDLDATFAHLQSLRAVRTGQIAVIGFCWGGSQTFRYAGRNPALKAAVVCYGGAPDSAAMTGIRAPVLGIYAEQDARINAGIPEAEATMRALGKTYRPRMYDGVGHAFLRRGPAPEARRAWTDVYAFLAETIGK